MLVLPLCPDRDYLGLLRHLTGWSVVRANANNFWSNQLSWQSFCEKFPLKMKCTGKLRALEFQQVCNGCWNVHTESSPSETDKQHLNWIWSLVNNQVMQNLGSLINDSLSLNMFLFSSNQHINQWNITFWYDFSCVSYVGGMNTPKIINPCLINRRLATRYPIVRLFTSGWKKLIAQLRWEFVTPV